MYDITIVNYIEIAGKTYLFDDLPDDKKQKVREVLQERALEPLGFRRKPA